MDPALQLPMDNAEEMKYLEQLFDLESLNTNDTFYPIFNPAQATSFAQAPPTSNEKGTLKKRVRPDEFDAPDLDSNMPSTIAPISPFAPVSGSKTPSQPPLDEPPIAVDDAQTLQQMNREIEMLQEELKLISNAQLNLPVPVQPSDFQQLDIDQRRMIETCYNYKKHLERIMSTNILSPQFNFTVLSIEHELNILLKKLALYQEELHYYCSYNPQTSQPRCFCSLVILKQPFPKPLKHNTRAQNVETEEPVIVELISAPKASCRPEGCVRAQLMHEDFHSKRASVDITNSEQPIDDDGYARFNDLRFPSGTRQKVVRLQFVLEVTYVQPNSVAGKQLLESDLTQPFIVMTNENQWKVSEGALFKKAAFEGQETIPWPKFANMLQVHYLRATRQNPVEPKRPLSVREIQYISQLEQFKNKSHIHIRDFESFWNWFGDAMHKIRHQKVFSSMWLQGEIFGFIDKKQVEELILRETSGTFLVRFSERSSGSVAVAYSELDPTSGRMKLKHYLVKPKEFDNLTDFFHTHSNFQWLLPANTDFGCRFANCSLPRIMKREFTARYLPPVKDGDTPYGYVPHLDQSNGSFFLPDI